MKITFEIHETCTFYIDEDTGHDEEGHDWSDVVARIKNGTTDADDLTGEFDGYIQYMRDHEIIEVEVRSDLDELVYLGVSD